jgi:hypothetical protein
VITKLADRRRVAVVDSDEIVRAEKEVDVVGLETVIAGMEVDAVQDDVQVAVVGLGLRVLDRAPRVLDRQRMERERVAQNQQFGNRRRREVHPQGHTRRRVEPPAVYLGGLLRPAVAVNEDRVHVMADG